MNSCTTLTVALHLRLQFPSSIALTTHSWLHWSHSLLKPWTSSLSLPSFVERLASSRCLPHTKPFRVLFCVQSPVLFCVFHSPSVSCFTEPFLFSVSYFSFSLVFPCCLVVWFLTFCLWPDNLSVLPSGYCSPIVDYACLLDYSPALPSIYLFAICSTLPVFWPCLLIKACIWICTPLV